MKRVELLAAVLAVTQTLRIGAVKRWRLQNFAGLLLKYLRRPSGEHPRVANLSHFTMLLHKLLQSLSVYLLLRSRYSGCYTVPCSFTVTRVEHFLVV